MRKYLLIAILSLFSLPIAHADFFDDSVMNTDLEMDMIDRIYLSPFSSADGRENTRYRNALKFVEWVKSESKSRYRDGKIGYYRMVDIVQDLDSLVRSMNQHFSYFARYEQTGRTVYRDESEDSYEEARNGYDRLRGALKRSTQSYRSIETNPTPVLQYYYPVPVYPVVW